MDVTDRKLRCPDHQRIPSYGVQLRDRQDRPIARAGRWVDTPVPAWTTKHHTHPTEKTPKDRSAFGETPKRGRPQAGPIDGQRVTFGP
jgi:hypothetical protein